jgi:hypothetical protein
VSGPLKLDGRRARALEAELLRRAEAVLSGDGRNPPVGTIARALFGAAARIGEEVTRRLDLAPAKQADNFYTAAGIGRDPARPAALPVAFKLVDNATEVVSAPGGTQLMAAAGGPVTFETRTRIDLVPGKVAVLRGLDADKDAVFMPSDAVIAAALPRAAALARRLRSGAAAGAFQLQVDPAAGLEPGMLLAIGEGDAAREYRALAVEGDLVTIDPPLETGVAENTPVAEVTLFAPFAVTTRDHQSHALYLAHATLLDVPSAATITVSGAALPADAEWSWWGKLGEDDQPDWQALGSGTSFTKAVGKLVKRKIGGQESLWLRAKLPGKSLASAYGQDVRIAIGGGACTSNRETLCVEHVDDLKVAFEAIANTTPVVPNGAFHPFGQEPRLYDAFYIGSSEAFSKVGAQVSLCFAFAGADLGPLAGIGNSDIVFGVGVDRQLYRLTLSPTKADLIPLPSPVDGGEIVPLQSQSPVAYWVEGTLHRVAVAAEGAVHVASLDSAGDPDKPVWMRLPLQNSGPVTALAVLAIGSVVTLYALQGSDLMIWNVIQDGANPSQQPKVSHLLPVAGADMILIVRDNGGVTEVVTQAAGSSQFTTITSVLPAQLPANQLSAYLETGTSAPFYIAGYDEEPPNRSARLRLVQIDATGANPTLPLPLWPRALPVALSLATAGLPPRLSIAETRPAHIDWYLDGNGNLAFTTAREPVSIGPSANPWRCFARSDHYTVVQRADFGALFRADPTGGGFVNFIRAPVSPTAPAVVVDAAAIPPATGTVLATFLTGRPDEIFNIAPAPAANGDRLLVLSQAIAADIPIIGNDLVFYQLGALSGNVAPAAAGRVSLANTVTVAAITALINDGAGLSVWPFATRATTNDDEWLNPGFPTPPALPPLWTYAELEAIATTQPAVREEVIPAVPAIVAAFSGGLVLWAADDAAATPVRRHSFGGVDYASYPHALIADGESVFVAAPPLWAAAGANLAANPDLSWQYWNGQSWWALATTQSGGEPLVDGTANFQRSGGVFFTVPADIKPTDVAGRTNHYVRVQLTGGDYGEAETKEVSQGVFKRDISTIRAPHITSLKLGYCAQELVPPEIVLTEDSLGFVDQTSANKAGLKFPAFTPIFELMNPPNAAEAAARAAADDGRCDDPCPDPDGAAPSPCDAPGAYDSCDSPCIAGEGDRRPAAGPSRAFARGLMVGFDKAFAGDTVSLYVDAEPAGLPAELVAEVLHGGRFVPINVVSDGSYGLTEPGILTLAMPDPPDLSAMFGATARWLRLRPKSSPSTWSPRLRGLHLNAALTLSVETRLLERLGASIGVEDQVFRLADGPVMAGSLELRVREPLSEEDKEGGALDIVPLASGPPGDWVRWEAADDLTEEEAPRRVFAFDPDRGEIRFGNGRNGQIPPLGADVMAFRYARVVGERANDVAAGSQVQLLAPLAGVDRVTALDHGAGGSDSEALDRARRRAAAKVRHGGRILTRADLEDYGLTLAPGIAQVRAETRRGGMRLIVVMKEPEPRPLPAQLRQFAAQIRDVAGFGLSHAGGLTLVGPRLLPLAVGLSLVPRAPDLFAEAAVQATACLASWFDPATGNHDGRGWPLGRLPAREDIAAALAPIAPLALPIDVTLARADKETAAERKLPRNIPSDVLVRIDPTAISFERTEEAA